MVFYTDYKYENVRVLPLMAGQNAAPGIRGIERRISLEELGAWLESSAFTDKLENSYYLTQFYKLSYKRTGPRTLNIGQAFHKSWSKFQTWNPGSDERAIRHRDLRILLSPCAGD